MFVFSWEWTSVLNVSFTKAPASLQVLKTAKIGMVALCQKVGLVLEWCEWQKDWGFLLLPVRRNAVPQLNHLNAFWRCEMCSYF